MTAEWKTEKEEALPTQAYAWAGSAFFAGWAAGELGLGLIGRLKILLFPC